MQVRGFEFALYCLTKRIFPVLFRDPHAVRPEAKGRAPLARQTSPPRNAMSVSFSCDGDEARGLGINDAGFAVAAGEGEGTGHTALYFMQMSHDMQVIADVYFRG